MRNPIGPVLVAGILAACTETTPPEPVAPAASRSLSRTARLLQPFDVSDPRIDLDSVLAGGPPKDGIPALTRPERANAADASFPAHGGRVVAVEIAGEAVAYPIAILNYHEIVNDVVGAVPVAVVYCPLCDSVSVLDRRLARGGDENRKPFVAEFGVSGLLYHSNVLMYERSTNALWSQVFMQAVTGPHAGAELRHLPIRMMTFGDFRTRFAKGQVITTDTGHQRPYERNPYASYFASDRPFRGMRVGGEALPPKTLGLGVKAGDLVAFVTAGAARAGDPYVLDTPLGPIRIHADDDAGLRVESIPSEARAVQTFYHAWSAFHPGTRVITE